MSEVTRRYRQKVYPAINAALPEHSQAGRKILITGATAVIGRAAAEAFVTAGADTVVITSRYAEKAAKVAKEIAAGGSTTVLGYQLDVGDLASVTALWDALARDGVEIDVLILNITELIAPPPERPRNESDQPIFSDITAPDFTLMEQWKYFESGVRNQLMCVDRFRAQGAHNNKVLLYISTNATHFHELPLHYLAVTGPRIAMNRMMSDLAMNIPVSELQILSIHPGLVPTPMNKAFGLVEGSLPVPFDEASLPGNFYVWASTKKAAFLHGRFVWSNWDVDDLIAMKPKFEADKGFLRMGLQGAVSQDFPMQLAAMARSE